MEKNTLKCGPFPELFLSIMDRSVVSLLFAMSRAERDSKEKTRITRTSR